MGQSEPPIDFPGTLLENSTVIEDAEIAYDDVVVAEFKTAGIKWIFEDGANSDAGKPCENCRNAMNDTIMPCTCKMYEYCSRKCMDQDRKYHSCFSNSSTITYGTSSSSGMSGSLYNGGYSGSYGK
jgi:hypothetical protein